MTKITKAQRELLERAVADPEGAVDAPKEAKLYRPLVKQGLAISLPVSGGWRLIITTAGRALLGEAGGGGPVGAEQEESGAGAAAQPGSETAPEPQPATDGPEADESGQGPAVEQDAPEASAEAGTGSDGELKPQAASDAGEGDAAEARPDAPPAAETTTDAAKPLPGGKLGKLVELLQRPTGATLEEMVEATGWQAHSVRGAMSGGLKKQRGLTITSAKTDGTRVYRIATGEQA